MKRYVVVGEAPGGKAPAPVGPVLQGKSGRLLCELAGCDDAAFRETFELVNLFPGRIDQWLRHRAIVKAQLLAAGFGGTRVVLLGRKVQLAFKVEGDYFSDSEMTTRTGATWIATPVPHPSGLSHWWNDGTNAYLAKQFWKRLFIEAVQRL